MRKGETKQDPRIMESCFDKHLLNESNVCETQINMFAHFFMFFFFKYKNMGKLDQVEKPQNLGKRT